MKLRKAYNMGAFGSPCAQLWQLVVNMPEEIIKKTFEIWSKSKIEKLKIEIENNVNLIEDIGQGIEIRDIYNDN